MIKLHKNQKKAVKASIKNDFSSGIHFHATGTGKSLVALSIVKEFNNKYPNKHILWICEQKDILTQQFDTENLKKLGFSKLKSIFSIHNYSVIKNNKWYENVNNSIIWKKPILLVINRAFLVSNQNYKNIKIIFDLIIHDECHSVSNTTTQLFYSHIKEKYNNVKCIGFSATPNINVEPFKNVITSYTILDAIKDGVIVHPKIYWLSSYEEINYKQAHHYIIPLLNKMPYKKIIVWCGMIKHAKKLAKLWSKYFGDYSIALDTSQEINSDRNTKKFLTYEDFEKIEEKAILFCACKHREGSDIKNLDTCIFMDKVESRTPKTFVQCIGRVLRKDNQNKKTYGLIIDLMAKGSHDICDRISQYLSENNNDFPWEYKQIPINSVTLHELMYRKKKGKRLNIINREKIYNKQDIRNRFVMKIPEDRIYKERIEKELNMMEDKNVFAYLVRALNILKLTSNVPHITRGSCGSSLVCYMLGISLVDPVKYNISFARFLNEYRNTLPDIDFDFPHFIRDDVFLKLQQKWKNCVARISNHNYYHEKSAIRQAFRNIGVRKFIGKYELNNEIKKLSSTDKLKLQNEIEKLTDSFKGYSLHCGGIIFFSEGIPKELILESKKNKIMTQITLNKEDVSRSKQFKIDILSSRGLSQLYKCYNYELSKIPKISDIDKDSKTALLLSSGDNIGITLCETPLIKKALVQLKPKSVKDIAICLAIIRPAAQQAKSNIGRKDLENEFVFDDDAIHFIACALNCSDDKADYYRKGFSKKDEKIMKELKDQLIKKKKMYILKKLENLRKYSFCKAHAYSYAELVWQLAYVKAHKPKLFWKSVLKYCSTSYRKWVHLYEAYRCNAIDDVFNSLKKKNNSIYSIAKIKKQSQLDFNNPTLMLKELGFWKFEKKRFFQDCYGFYSNDCYIFRGILASCRTVKGCTTIMMVGVGEGEFIEVIVKQTNNFIPKMIGIKGKCQNVKKYGNYISVQYSEKQFNDKMYYRMF